MSSKVCMILVWFFVICLLVVGLVMVSSTAAWACRASAMSSPSATRPCSAMTMGPGTSGVLRSAGISRASTGAA